MLTKIDKQLLKRLLREDTYKTVLKLSSELIDKWKNENIIGATEFETLKLLFTRESKVEGLKEFLNLLETEADQ